MFDYIQYGILPLFLQVKIQKLGMEHPIAKIIKKINLPIEIYSRDYLDIDTFSEIFFLFF